MGQKPLMRLLSGWIIQVAPLIGRHHFKDVARLTCQYFTDFCKRSKTDLFDMALL